MRQFIQVIFHNDDRQSSSKTSFHLANRTRSLTSRLISYLFWTEKCGRAESMNGFYKILTTNLQRQTTSKHVDWIARLNVIKGLLLTCVDSHNCHVMASSSFHRTTSVEDDASYYDWQHVQLKFKCMLKAYWTCMFISECWFIDLLMTIKLSDIEHYQLIRSPVNARLVKKYSGHTIYGNE